MAKRYIKISPFYDRPSILGPLSAARLNAMNDALDACDTELENKLDKNKIADNLITNDATFALSAKQGKILNDNLVTSSESIAVTVNTAVASGATASVAKSGNVVMLSVVISGMVASGTGLEYALLLSGIPTKYAPKVALSRDTCIKASNYSPTNNAAILQISAGATSIYVRSASGITAGQAMSATIVYLV